MNCSKLTDVLKIIPIAIGIQEINRFIVNRFAVGYCVPKDHSTLPVCNELHRYLLLLLFFSQSFKELFSFNPLG